MNVKKGVWFVAISLLVAAIVLGFACGANAQTAPATAKSVAEVYAECVGDGGQLIDSWRKSCENVAKEYGKFLKTSAIVVSKTTVTETATAATASNPTSTKTRTVEENSFKSEGAAALEVKNHELDVKNTEAANGGNISAGKALLLGIALNMVTPQYGYGYDYGYGQTIVPRQIGGGHVSRYRSPTIVRR